jgi:hypothetical protein
MRGIEGRRKLTYVHTPWLITETQHEDSVCVRSIGNRTLERKHWRPDNMKSSVQTLERLSHMNNYLMYQ